ncbi:MAG TPA: phosphoglycerate mutase [Rhodanobacteraceae bacterium]|nr:phosphoglycerate mutase [Rhodanobacteraceae bacterium]
MSVLHVLLPALSRCAQVPALRRWRQRGDTLDAVERGRLAAIAVCFRVPTRMLPVAALTRDFAAGDAGGASWMCADPASVQPDMSGARMLACGNLELTADEAAALVQDLGPLFEAHDCRLEPTTPSRWHLRLPPGTSAPQSASAEQVLGDDLLPHLPQGPGARRWRVLFNEVQMALHEHPVNRTRQARGQLPVNAVWLWGGGSLPAAVQTSVAQVFSDDALVRALAVRARVAVAQPVADFGIGSAVANVDTLLDLGLAGDVDAATRQLLSVWRHGRIDAMLLAFESGERIRVRHWHRWRAWRRA